MTTLKQAAQAALDAIRGGESFAYLEETIAPMLEKVLEETSQLHTCSYSCTRPACVLAQRDELRAKLEDSQDAATFFANLQKADELLRQALEALESANGNINPERGFADEVETEINTAITTLRERLGETK